MSTPNTAKPTDGPTYRQFLAPRYWPTWFALGLLRLITSLPHPARLSVGRTLGRLGYVLARSRRHVAQTNIRLCFPRLDEKQRQALVKKHFEALGIGLIEIGMSWWRPNQELLDLVHFDGMEHLTAGLAEGHGAILLSAHFTPVDLSCRLLTIAVATPLFGLYQRHPNPLMEEIIQRNRLAQMAGMIPREGVRQMVRVLRDNCIVWYAPDQAYDGKGSEVVPFFGEPAISNTATSRLAKVSGAPVFPYFLRRTESGRYIATILPALDNFPSDDVISDTQRYHALVEAQAQLAPEQYLWVHKRFKDRPEEFGDPY